MLQIACSANKKKNIFTAEEELEYFLGERFNRLHLIFIVIINYTCLHHQNNSINFLRLSVD